MVENTSGADWSEDIYSVLKAKGISQITTVPDGGLASLLRKCEDDKTINVVTLSTEEEGVAFSVGAWLGGVRSALLIQSSGVGNCINMLSLPATCRTPLLMLVTMRGEWGEFNPWQVPMGRATRSVFEAMDVTVYKPQFAEQIGETFASAANYVFSTGRSAAVLVSQQIIGVKNFLK